MCVHLDRAHHHPRVFKRGDFWEANCVRCGSLTIPGLPTVTRSWRLAIVAALCHAGVQS